MKKLHFRCVKACLAGQLLDGPCHVTSEGDETGPQATQWVSEQDNQTSFLMTKLSKCILYNNQLNWSYGKGQIISMFELVDLEKFEYLYT